MQHIIIYHNPKCGTSRNVLGFIQEAGFEPLVIEYLKNPPSESELQDLIAKMNIRPQSLVRINNNEENDVVKNLSSFTDVELIKAMVADPILINRPIVVIGEKVRLCRPSETVKEMLDGLSND